MLPALLLLAVIVWALSQLDIIRRLVVFVASHRPCKIITYDGQDILRRYHLLELPGGMTLVLHQFVRSDPDRGLHDHPWSFGASFVLAGGYFERRVSAFDGPVGKDKAQVPIQETWFAPGRFNTFNGEDYHRVFVPTGQDAWTLFLSGPRIKTWGFLKCKGDNEPYQYASYSKTVADPDGRWWLDPKYSNKR